MSEKMVSIDIVYPPSESGNENYSSEPPLGPIALGSSLPKEIRSHTRFLDSTIMGIEEIERLLIERKATIIAFSCTTFNYPAALRLATMAKQQGSVVVMGGIHITYLWDRIIAKMETGERPMIDYLLPGDGEPSFYQLMRAVAEEISINDVPGLVYLDGKGKRIINAPAPLSRTVDPLLAPLDYSAINLGAYAKKFHGSGNLAHVKMPAGIWTQRGCVYSGPRKCTFCSIPELNPKRPANLVYEDVRSLVMNYGVDHIRINDGDFTASPRHMENVARAVRNAVLGSMKPPPVFHCFARADEIDEKRVRILKSLNVVSVFIGYESGSDQMLRVMHKNTTCKQNLEATQLLKDNGIDVACAGIVLGAEGETKKTLDDTRRFIHDLKDIGNTCSLVATPSIPLPGSPDSKKLQLVLEERDPVKAKELREADIFDIQELTELWNHNFCSVPIAELIDVSEEIEKYFKIGIRLLRFREKH